MKTLELTVDYVNDVKSEEIFINDFNIDDDSLLELAALLGCDDMMDAWDWFMSNYDVENEEIEVIEFYNETISRQDLRVYYEADYVAHYQDTKIIARIDWHGEEMYDNEPAKQWLAEHKGEGETEMKTLELNPIAYNSNQWSDEQYFIEDVTLSTDDSVKLYEALEEYGTQEIINLIDDSEIDYDSTNDEIADMMGSFLDGNMHSLFSWENVFITNHGHSCEGQAVLELDDITIILNINFWDRVNYQTPFSKFFEKLEDEQNNLDDEFKVAFEDLTI